MSKTAQFRTGLVLAALLGLLDTFSFLGPDGPPLFILVLSTVLGLITLAAVIWAWRTASNSSVWTIVVARVLSALSAVPVFFVDDVSITTSVKIICAIFIAVTVVTVWFVLAGRQQTE